MIVFLENMIVFSENTIMFSKKDDRVLKLHPSAYLRIVIKIYALS